MARIEFSANPPPPSGPRQPPPSGADETPNTVDYISELPTDIILRIFSFLTTNDAIKTSVLSKRWRSTWTANPHISFRMPRCYEISVFQSFMASMEAVLLRCTAIKVKSFFFDADFDAPFLVPRTHMWRRFIGGPTIHKWLHFAVEHDVEDVSVILHNKDIYELPRFFFRCTTLVSFRVLRCCFSKMGAVNWSSLKRLHIAHVELKDNTMMRVLRGCPVLEFFELDGCWGFEHVNVKSRSLTELVIKSHHFPEGKSSILKISAPHLLKLRLLGYSENKRGEFKVDKVCCLVEAELNFSTYNNDGGIVKALLQSLHHVTKLVIGSWCLQVLSLTLTKSREVFLLSLECWHLMIHIASNDHQEAPGIAKILDSSPHLEKLILQVTFEFYWVPHWNHGRGDFDAEEFWNSTKRRPYRCLTHLKNVEIVDHGSSFWCAWETVLSLLKSLLLQKVEKIEISRKRNNYKVSKRAYPYMLLDVARIFLSHPNRSPHLKVIIDYPSRRCPSTSLVKCDFTSL